MSKIGLEFLQNTGGDSEGLSEAGIETFRDKPFAAVARETGQNSRDARLDPEKPVKMTFDIVRVPSSKFPSILQYRDATSLCLKKVSKSKKNEKEKGFFEQAMKVLNAPEIKILKISDYNTKGVRGPCVEGTPFHTLAKSDGVSTKEDVSSGGSFGIGKNAVFALSDIQTAFFSTIYKDDRSNDQFLCMGKTMYISHPDDKGVERRRKGYWGILKGYTPVDRRDDVPEWLRRDCQGTSIYSICMRSNKADWRYEMAAAIIINFFCAIERQEMEFEIDSGTVLINRGTLQTLFTDPKVLEAVKQLNATVMFEAAKALHACLVDKQKEIVDLDIEGLGKIRLHVLLREGLGYTIGFIRNGMYITDNLTNFNESFKRFPLHRDFAIVAEPVGNPESEWFKRLENPRHDDLSAERITDPDLRGQGQAAFERLAKKMRDKIRDFARSEPSSKVELDELNEFFASDAARQEDDAGTVTDARAFKPTPVKKSPPKSPKSAARKDDDKEPAIPVMGPGVDGIGGGGGGTGDGEGGDDHGGGGRPGVTPPGPQPTSQPQGTPIELEGERNLLPDVRQPRKRRIYFTSPVTGTVRMYIEATGLSVPDRLSIVKVEGATLEGDCIAIKCRAGVRAAVDVEFGVAYEGPIETEATVIADVEGAAA